VGSVGRGARIDEGEEGVDGAWVLLGVTTLIIKEKRRYALGVRGHNSTVWSRTST